MLLCVSGAATPLPSRLGWSCGPSATAMSTLLQQGARDKGTVGRPGALPSDDHLGQTPERT